MRGDESDLAGLALFETGSGGSYLFGNIGAGEDSCRNTLKRLLYTPTI